MAEATTAFVGRMLRDAGRVETPSGIFPMFKKDTLVLVRDCPLAGYVYIKECPFALDRSAKTVKVPDTAVKLIKRKESGDHLSLMAGVARIYGVDPRRIQFPYDRVTYDNPTSTEVCWKNTQQHYAEIELARKGMKAPTEAPKAVTPEPTHTEPTEKESAPMTQPEEKKVTLKGLLRSTGLTESLVSGVASFYKEHKLCQDDVESTNYLTLDELVSRRPQPEMLYRGADAWNTAVTALLEGYNILLEGPKATGKNVLADSLCFLFGRPKWDVSFHFNIDEEKLIGAFTLKGGNVQFNPGPLYLAGAYGGFAVLDEINMAKADAIAALHSALDGRRILDVPGHGKLDLHPATRFIGTMNYGYTGTKELNEALVSRFVVVSIPHITQEDMAAIISVKYDGQFHNKGVEYVYQMFSDISRKAEGGEISTRCVDLRGFIAGLSMVRSGMAPYKAFEACIANKAFDQYERQLVKDVIKSTCPESADTSLFMNPTVSTEVGGSIKVKF